MKKEKLIKGRNMSRYNYYIIRLCGRRGIPLKCYVKDMANTETKKMFNDRLFGIVFSKLGWESKNCLYYRAWRGELDSDKIISINKKALKGYVRSYNVKIVNSKDPKMQFIGVEGLLTDLLKEMIGHKYMQTLVVTFKKNKIHKMAYFNRKQKTIINTNEITSGLLEPNAEITKKIDVWISE